MQTHRCQKVNILGKYLFLFLFGAIVYYLIEVLWRGYSYFSMAILGGACFVIIGLLNEHIFFDNIGLLYQMILSSGIVTLLELISGIILNVWLKLDIWDYSNLPFNFMGQICLPFSLAWVLLSLIAIIVDDYLRYKFFDEPFPKYHIL